MFKIGEFARIADVSGHLLRHYDDIGLFRPSYVDPQSGYRYYKMDQLPRLNRIIVLRDLGLTLEQITHYLNGDMSDCEIRGMLALKRAQVEQTIAEEQARLRRIESRLHQMAQETAPTGYTILCKSLPEVPYLSTGWQHLTDQQGVQISREAALWLEHKHNIKATFPLVIVHDRPNEDGSHNIEVGVALKKPLHISTRIACGHQLAYKTLPAVQQMATTLHHGPRTHVEDAYQAVFRWMEVNGYHFMPDSPVRERYLQPVLAPQDAKNIVEIQVPITINKQVQPKQPA